MDSALYKPVTSQMLKGKFAAYPLLRQAASMLPTSKPEYPPETHLYMQWN